MYVVCVCAYVCACVCVRLCLLGVGGFAFVVCACDLCALEYLMQVGKSALTRRLWDSFREATQMVFGFTRECV